MSSESWASTKDTNIPEVRTPPALGWNKTSPRWKAASPLRSSPAAWRQLTQFLQCTNRATTSCAATTFLNGHSDGLGGVVVCTKREQAEKLAFLQKAAGAILSPFECWLVLRGVRTLAVRMEQHDRNGRFVAEFLARHKKVKQVFYPGLPDHPQYELAQQQMSGFGSMITFETGSLSNAKKMLRKVRLCSLAESLGGVETLISHPATMTHGAIGEKGRKEIGITDGMVRISVGIENVEDIMDDLDQALAAI